MSFSLPLPTRLKAQWKIKIRDLERVEPPHVHVLRNTESWRIDLRTDSFMDSDPDPADVPTEVRDIVTQNLPLLRTKWNQMYPENPV